MVGKFTIRQAISKISNLIGALLNVSLKNGPNSDNFLIKICILNIQGFRSKLVESFNFLNSNNIDICLLSETKIRMNQNKFYTLGY